MRAQCSLRASMILLLHSNLRIGAESKAESNAKYELKLLCFRNSFIILINLLTSFSLSFCSSCCRILVRHQKLTLLKCSVNLVRLGDLSSFCSWTQSINSAESSLRKSWASNKVICSAKSKDLKLNRLKVLWLKLKNLHHDDSSTFIGLQTENILWGFEDTVAKFMT